MNHHPPTTPFGRRPLTLAHVAANAGAKASPDTPVHKWQVFRDICAARILLDVSERSLAVLDALLSFHPETVLTGEGLIVFPSNRQLCLRAHGMAEATLRRHLAALAGAGLIVRRDSPNGKRYARRSGGAVEMAFGFDLAPIAARAVEFARLAAAVRAEDLALRLVRERITLCRRDIVKMIALGFDEGQEWQRHHDLFRSLIERLPRGGSRAELEPIAEELTLLAEELENLLELLAKSKEKTGNADQFERHLQNSNPEPPIESEPSQPSSSSPDIEPLQTISPRPVIAFPLGMVLDACPDLIDYAKDGITSWRDFFATVAGVRPMLGISPTAWEDALDVLGEQHGSIVVAAILQRGTEIGSAGGYLRDLTRRKLAGEFNVGPMIMALLSKKLRKGRLRA